MPYEPTGALEAALGDGLSWIRLGAAQVAPSLAPAAANDLLLRLIQNSESRSPVERAVMIAAFARAGGDVVDHLAALLNESPRVIGEVIRQTRAAFGTGRSPWIQYLSEKVADGTIDGRSARFLWPAALIYAPVRTEAGTADETPPGEDELRAAHALSTFRFWHDWRQPATSRPKPVPPEFAQSLEALRGGRTRDAIDALAVLALTSADPWVRGVTKKLLPVLGPAAASPFLNVLAGGDGPRPGQDVVRSIASEPAHARLADTDPEALAGFLAAEALEQFHDFETVTSLTSLYFGGPDAARSRAARVLARMPVDAAMPSLLWASANLPSPRERGDARALIDRVINDKDAFDIHYHHVGTRLVEAENLSWISDLAHRGDLGGWGIAPGTAWPILNAAISLTPGVSGQVDIMYSDARTPDRANAFMRSIERIKRWLPWSGEPPVNRHLYPFADLKDRCYPDEEVTLSVWLDPSATGAIGEPIEVPFDRDEKVKTLGVAVSAPGFEIRSGFEFIEVSREGVSTVAKFKLRARGRGAQAIDVKFVLGAEIIGHCCVVTQITKRKSSGRAQTIQLEPVEIAALERHPAAAAILLVHTLGSGVLQWRLLEPGKAPRLLGDSPQSFGKSEISRLIAAQTELWRDAMTVALSPDDMIGMLSQISAIGHDLLAQIAPAAAIEAIAALAEDSMLVIESDADWVPWELLAHASDAPPWGERFVLVRAPLVTEPPEEARPASSASSGALASAALIVGDKISNPRQLPGLTFAEMADRVTPLVGVDWSKLKAGVKAKDIVHFVCHGRSNPFHLSYGPTIGRRLLVGMIKELDFAPGAVVFANACRSGATELLLSDFQSFGRAFYLAGARPFIGTLGPVPEKEAVAFSALFYRNLGALGLPAGHALLEARRTARQTFAVPVWLLYCLYGTGSATRRSLAA